MATKLLHEASGREVQLMTRAELNQACPLCKGELRGTSIVHVEGAKAGGVEIGWFHLWHLEHVLQFAPKKTPAVLCAPKHMARTL